MNRGRWPRASIAELEPVVLRAQELNQKAIQSGDDGYWDGAALNLHGFYSGVERIFEDIARSMDSSLPSGPDWHRRLLVQMAAESAKVRPAVLSRETYTCLEDYRGFRHIVRNVYAFQLRPARVRELCEKIQDCYTAVQRELLAFAAFLEELN